MERQVCRPEWHTPGTRLRFELRPAAPFAFDLVLRYLRSSPSSIVEVVTPDAYRRALYLDGRPVLLTVTAGSSDRTRAVLGQEDVQSRPFAPHGGRVEGGGPGSSLEVSLHGSSLSDADGDAAERIVRRLFSTSDNLSGLEAIAAADPVFGKLVHAYRGLRPVLIPDVFETIVWAIVGQQVNVQFAAKCKRALVERFGQRFTFDGDDYLLFPTPEQLATASESDLAALQLSRQKTRYILGLSRMVVDGTLRLDDLRRVTADEARERLERIVGIGRWTAEYVLMRGLGHRDVIPAADGGLRRIIGQAYGLGRLATESEVRALAEHWVGWRSYAAFYWWFALQQETEGRRALGTPRANRSSRPLHTGEDDRRPNG